jgi:glutamine---fructose-6-phosphate transaminase (isomerizing)
MQPIQDTHLYQEIHQQPGLIQKLVKDPNETILAIADQIRSRGIKQVFIAARGTSDNAGRYAQYLLGAHNRMVVTLATPSLFTIYRQAPDLSNTLVVGISQSGKSPDIVSVLEEANLQGALTIAVTNYSNSDLGQAAKIVMDLGAGEEVSLAATKTYTTQLASLAILSLALAPSAQRQHDLSKLPHQVAEIFALEDHVKQLVERYRYMTHCAVIGRGFNYASAFEFSLKMKELTYTIAEPYSSADFLHGPVALVDRGFPVFVIAPSGKMIPEMKSTIEEVQKRDAEVIILSDQPDLLNMSAHTLVLPGGVPEWLSPITAIIPAQMFAMYLANTRGIDVDNPRGLKKVTETW